jgi:glycogen synthase
MSLGQAARQSAGTAAMPSGSFLDPGVTRILLLNYEYPPLGGGAGVATEAIARRLAARGFQVDVVTAGAPAGARVARQAERLGSAGGRLSLFRVRSCRVGLHEASMRDAAGYLRAALPVIRRLAARHRYDVVHCFFSLPTGALLRFAGLGETPVVLSLRGSDVPGYDPHNRFLQVAHRALLPLTRSIWRSAARVVALSDSLGRLAATSDASLRYSVIRNGVDLDLFHPPATPRTLRTDRVRCLAVARLVERKGLDDLLHALARQERGRFELEIVGTGHDEARLRRLVRSLSLGNEVRFLGALDRSAVAARYREADLFTLASWEESFGNVFAEALASGLPIVGSRAGGIPEFIADGVNGILVPPRDPAALAEALHRLAGDLVTRARMRARNRADAEQKLGWDRVADAYLDLYAQAR